MPLSIYLARKCIRRESKDLTTLSRSINDIDDSLDISTGFQMLKIKK